MSFLSFAIFENNTKGHSLITKTQSQIVNCKLLIQTLSSVTFQRKESLGARKERLIHKAGHVGWMKDTACEK